MLYLFCAFLFLLLSWSIQFIEHLQLKVVVGLSVMYGILLFYDWSLNSPFLVSLLTAAWMQAEDQDGMPSVHHLSGSPHCRPGPFLLCLLHWDHFLQQMAHEGKAYLSKHCCCNHEDLTSLQHTLYHLTLLYAVAWKYVLKSMFLLGIGLPLSFVHDPVPPHCHILLVCNDTMCHAVLDTEASSHSQLEGLLLQGGTNR